MFSFDDLDSDIQTRIPDRPARRVPVMISQMPEIPWLASKYVPKPSDKPSVKTFINMFVKNAIPLLGILAVCAVLGLGAMKIIALY